MLCGGQASWLDDGWLAAAWGFLTVAGENDPMDLVSPVGRRGRMEEPDTHLAAFDDLAGPGSSDTPAMLAFRFNGGLGHCEGTVSCVVTVLEVIWKNSPSHSPSPDSHTQKSFWFGLPSQPVPASAWLPSARLLSPSRPWQPAPLSYP